MAMRKSRLAWLRIAEDETWSSSKASKFETTPSESSIIRRACQAQASNSVRHAT